MKVNRRQLIQTGAATGAAIALAGGGAWYLLRDDEPKGTTDRIDLLTGVIRVVPPYTPADFERYAMLTLTGGMPKNMGMAIRFFDLQGEAESVSAPPSATLRNLVSGEFTEDVAFTATDDGWELTQEAIRSEGWWQLMVSLGDAHAMYTFLVPDPNLTGFGTPPVIDADPEAKAMLAASLNHLTNRESLRWWEWLSGGNGAIILASFSITTMEHDGLEPGFENNSMLAGRIPPDGGPATFRMENPRTVTVGERAFRRVDGGSPEAVNVARYLPISSYDTTYAGHDGERFGIEAEIGGRQCQLVSFHLPGFSEAWFAFWIDKETLQLRELFMLSVNHYMHWVYYDVDEPFQLEP